MENRIRLVGPATLMPVGIDAFGAEVFHDMEEGLKDVDVVMMLRLQRERMDGGFIPSEREYYHRYGFCLLYTSPSPRDRTRSRMPSSA